MAEQAPTQTEHETTGGGEAICFTAGSKGAAFGAGVIHAWLASDHSEPRVVAGISTGAITAAAMQRAMEERATAEPRTEANRWEWFQKYLGDILDRPLDVIWKSFPDPVDFLSATTPVRDLSCPPSLQADERRARYHFWILTKLGQWISSLPVSIGELGRLAVLYVRYKEGLPLALRGTGWTARFWRGLLVAFEAVFVFCQVLAAMVSHGSFGQSAKPGSLPQQFTPGHNESEDLPGFRPLFGWTSWIVGLLLAALIAIAAIVLPVLSLRWIALENPHASTALLCDVVLLALCSLLELPVFRAKTFARKMDEAANGLGEDGILESSTNETAIEHLLEVLRARYDQGLQLPGTGRPTRFLRGLLFWLQLGLIVCQVLPVVVFKPSFTRTWRRFSADEEHTQGKRASPGFPGFRPLFGGTLWVVAGLLLAVLAVTLVVVPLLSLWGFVANRPYAAAALWFDLLFVAASGIVAALYLRPKSFEKKLSEMADSLGDDGTPSVAKKTAMERLLAVTYEACCIDLHIISNYQLKRRIWNRFTAPGQPEPSVRCDDQQTKTNLVIVAAALQPLFSKKDKAVINHQCWAHSGVPLVDALTTACAIQPLFPKTHLTTEAKIRQWLRKKEADALLDGCRGAEPELDLVDGAVIRTNPLPALFNWLQEESHHNVAASLESEANDPRIHVIYNVPIEPFDAYEGKAPPDRIDLIEAAEVGILMRARRDTQVEVKQTNFLSRIIKARKSRGGSEKNWLALFADEIAPAREFNFANSLAPTREEGLRVAAEGCRRTLGRLYQSEIQQWPGVNGTMGCEQLLRQVAPQRRAAQFRCGLPEVCAHCTGRLEAYPTPAKPALVKADFGDQDPRALLRKKFAPLYKESLPDGRRKPRVVFVASGGVFRGAFHIGLLGAMQALDITPDLVVGASVGSLMGGALAAMRYSSSGNEQRSLLAELTRTFMHVDETVALTVPVKTAVKEVGLRARGLKLSPASLRAAVRAGTASDVGYASTGVPPMVIDTLSQLLIIPPAETIKAGSDFLAGRFAQAASNLIQLMRTNTLDNLGIRYAVLGTSLLEGVARNLMGASVPGIDLNKAQPFLRNEGNHYKGTAVFCTTAYVNYRWLLLLGRDALTPAADSFRFLYAAMSSSAFPAAFPARQEAEVFPGTGQVSNLFCDGGTFDNLPFIPAIELLQETQTLREHQKPLDFLREVLETPDLIISGGFDPLPSMAPRQTFRSRGEISKRSSALGAAVKTDSFISMSEQVTKQLHKLAQEAVSVENVSLELRKVMTESVVAGVVNVVPATELHVNPTFGFSKTLGFTPERVAASIANGCFQTMRGLQKGASTESDVAKSLKLLKKEVAKRNGAVEACGCPYFNVKCAFAEAAVEAKEAPVENLADPCTATTEEESAKRKVERDLSKVRASDCQKIYRACCTDPVHRRLAQLRT